MQVLVKRMLHRDREAAATFMCRYQDQLIRRIRGKLRAGNELRRVFDSQDIASTIGRRLDSMVDHGKLRATSEAELWSLLSEMMEHALVDKHRLFRRNETARREDHSFLHAMSEKQAAAAAEPSRTEVDLDRMSQILNDATDEQILELRSKGAQFDVIAPVVGISQDAARQRWRKIKRSLRQYLERSEDRG